MGMGLPIVKKIVENLKGQLNLLSTPNQGAKFEIILRKYEGSKPKALYSIKSTNKEYLKPGIADIVKDNERSNVLLIEDNSDLLSYLIKKLKERYNIYVAKNGLQALEKLNHIDHLDIIISDIMMDHIDGYELLKLISGKKKFSHVPFLFITAKSIRDRSEALEMGTIDYINKPFKIFELINRIESLLCVFRKQRNAVVNQA
jgi:two-component system, sensor histidine kinase ChiS